MGLDRIGIKRIVDFKTLQSWLERLALILEESYSLQKDVVEGGTAAETPNWLVREANATDVTNGEARAVGNLIVLHKTTGTKFEYEA